MTEPARSHFARRQSPPLSFFSLGVVPMPRTFAAFLFVTLACVTHAGDGPALSADHARRFAAEIANAHCKWKFGCRPFDASSAEPTLKNGRWHGRAIAGHGYSDFVTEV